MDTSLGARSLHVPTRRQVLGVCPFAATKFAPSKSGASATVAATMPAMRPLLLAACACGLLAAGAFQHPYAFGMAQRATAPPWPQDRFPAASIPAMEAEAGRILFLGARLQFETDRGSFTLVTFPREAPKTVAQITRLVREGFYDGLAVHRLVRNTAVQMGDPGTRTLPPGDAKVGRGGSGNPLPPEYQGQTVRYLAGTVGLARGKDPNSGDSQFFITVASSPHLEENYTIFAHVVQGMDVVRLLSVGDRIKKASILQEDPGAPSSPNPAPSPS